MKTFTMSQICRPHFTTLVCKRARARMTPPSKSGLWRTTIGRAVGMALT